mmetsp:Transcript_72454/g.169801  ORF Transcript_72454/g.169801 Transcript_72454/m.169801 type:complete len:267 (-) Transcript_72454:379-1179(-)
MTASMRELPSTRRLKKQQLQRRKRLTLPKRLAGSAVPKRRRREKLQQRRRKKRQRKRLKRNRRLGRRSCGKGKLRAHHRVLRPPRSNRSAVNPKRLLRKENARNPKRKLPPMDRKVPNLTKTEKARLLPLRNAANHRPDRSVLAGRRRKRSLIGRAAPRPRNRRLRDEGLRRGKAPRGSGQHPGESLRPPRGADGGKPHPAPGVEDPNPHRTGRGERRGNALRPSGKKHPGLPPRARRHLESGARHCRGRRREASRDLQLRSPSPS